MCKSYFSDISLNQECYFFLAQMPTTIVSLPKVVPHCDVVADVGFILDTAVGTKQQFNNEQNFIKTIAARLNFGYDTVRGSVVSFSDDAKLSIRFSDYKSIDIFSRAIDVMELKGTASRMEKALRLSQNEMFRVQNGARRGVPKILVLMTNSAQTTDKGMEDPIKIAKHIRRLGIHLIVIGIGANLNFPELYYIGDDEKNVYMADTFDRLVDEVFLKDISMAICSSGKLNELIDYLSNSVYLRFLNLKNILIVDGEITVTN